MNNNVKNVMIVESFNQSTFKEITSASTPKGMMLVEGVLGVVDVVNRNNRIYAREEYVAHVNDLNRRIQESNGVFGELEHPKSMTINLNNISHKVMEVKVLENGNVWGKVLLLDTPKGQIAQSVVRSGSPLPISSRAQGQVQENGNVKLSHLSTYDLVGTAGFAQAALTESVVVEGQGVFESYLFDLNENGNIVEEQSQQSVNENQEIDYAVIESILSKLIDKKIANGAIKTVNVAESANNDLDSIQEAIDEAMLNKYMPIIESWMTTEFAPTMAESVQQWVTTEFAPVLESWVTNEFAPVVESWVTSEYTPMLESWLSNEAFPNLSEQFGGTGLTKANISTMIDEAFTSRNILTTENVETPVNPAFTEIDANAEIFKSNLLAKLDAKISDADGTHDEPAANTDKPAFVDESAFKMHSPMWLQKCPTEYKHVWNSLNENQKSEVYRRASVRIIETNEDVQTFWNGLNFQEIVENKNTPYRRNTSVIVNENLNMPQNNFRNGIASMAKQLKS